MKLYVIRDHYREIRELVSRDGDTIHNPPILMRGVRITAFTSKARAQAAIDATKAYRKSRGFSDNFAEWKIRPIIIAK